MLMLSVSESIVVKKQKHKQKGKTSSLHHLKIVSQARHPPMLRLLPTAIANSQPAYRLRTQKLRLPVRRLRKPEVKQVRRQPKMRLRPMGIDRDPVGIISSNALPNQSALKAQSQAPINRANRRSLQQSRMSLKALPHTVLCPQR